MKKIINFLFCFIFFTGVSLNSRASIHWPRGVDSSTDVFQAYRGLLQIKLSQLPSNFITVFEKDRVLFQAITTRKKNIGKIRRIVNQNGDQTTITFIYFNKHNQVIYKEKFSTTGKNKFDISLKKYLSSKLKLTLNSGDTYKRYQFIDGHGRVIIQFSLENYNGNELFNFKFMDKPLFVWNLKILDQGLKDERIDLLLTYLPASFSTYSPDSHSKFSFGNVHGNYTNKIIDYKNRFDRRFISSKGVEISLNKFRENSSYNIYRSRISLPQTIISALTKYVMPTTKVEQATGQNQKLLNELQLLINKLDASDIAFVKNQLIILKKSVASGEINDKRH